MAAAMLFLFQLSSGQLWFGAVTRTCIENGNHDGHDAYLSNSLYQVLGPGEMYHDSEFLATSCETNQG